MVSEKREEKLLLEVSKNGFLFVKYLYKILSLKNSFFLAIEGGLGRFYATKG